ncbi:MAG: metallophosphoesterase family protein [Chitinophagaceae bacterium]
MKKIGIISDTHHWLDEQVTKYFSDRDEIWHGGDFGNIEVAKELEKMAPLRGVYGNIDGYDIRSVYPELNVFTCEGVKVMMIHIAGHPQRYAPGIKELLALHRPQLMICGHSHILKIMYDQKFQYLHVNPGAAGKQGWQKVRTIVRLTIDGKEMKDCQVIELGKRG